LLHQRLEALEDPPDVHARTFRIVDGEAPDRLAFLEVAAECGALQFGVLGEEGIAVGELGDGAQEGALGGREKGHGLYSNCTTMYINCTEADGL
jgi:hypothetical protein